MGDVRTPDKQRRRKPRKWPWLLIPIAVPAALVVGLAIGTVLYLATDAGKQFVVYQALRLANGAIPGSLTVEEATINWIAVVELDGVSAVAPDGEPLFHAARIVVRYRPLSVIRGRIEVTRLRLERPSLTLAYDDQGVSNLDRFLGPSGEEPETPSEPWDGRLPIDVEVPRMEIVGGTFSMADATSSPQVVARLDHINLDAAYRASGPVHQLTMAPFEATLLEPDVGHISVALNATYDLSHGQDEVRVDGLRLNAEGLEARGAANFTGFDWPVGQVALSFDRIDPRFVHRFDETIPMTGSVRLALSLDLDARKQAKVAVAVGLPEGRIDLSGRLDLASVEADVDTLGYDIDLATSKFRADSVLDLGLPPLNPLNLRATVRGRGVTPDTMDTRFKVDVAPMVYQGYTFNGGKLSGLVQAGMVVIEGSHIESPYATLDAQGLVDLGGPIRATVTLSTPDLSRLGHPLDLPLGGDLQTKLRISGTMDEPLVDLSLASTRLEYGPPDDTLAVLRGVTGTGTIRVSEERGNTVVRATFKAQGLEAGFPDPLLNHLSVAAHYDGKIDGSLDATDVYGHPLHVAVQYDLEAETTVTVSGLTLPLGETPWSLDAPVEVRVVGDDVLISPFTLAGPDGYLSGRIAYRPGGENDILLVADGVVLDNFAPFVQADLPGLRGKLAIDARAAGSTTEPDIRATLSLLDLSTTELPLIDARVHLSTRHGPSPGLSGNAAFGFPGKGNVTARFDLPMTVSLEGDTAMVAGGAVSADLTLSAVDLTQFSGLLASYIENLSGTLEGSVTLSGSPESPRLEGHLSAREVSGLGAHPLDLRLGTRYSDSVFHLDGQVLSPLAGPVPLVMARMEFPVRVTPDLEPEPLWDGQVDGTVIIPGQKLAQFSALDASLDRAKGDIQLKCTVAGRLGDPSVRVDLRGRGIRPPGYPPIHVDVEAGYEEGRAGAVVRTQIADTRPAYLEATLRLPLADMIQGKEVSPSDLEAYLDVPELDFLQLPPILRGPQVTSGSLRMRARLECPVDTPSFSASLAIEDLSVGGSGHDITLATSFSDQTLRLAAAVRGPEGKEATVAGTVPLELRLGLASGDVETAYPPGLDIDTRFQDLDLRLVDAVMPSGIRLEGTMKGMLHLGGSLEVPEGRGHVDVANALFYYPEYGILYKHIDGRVTLTPTLVTLEDASLDAGKGQVAVDGTIALVDDSPEAMDLKARADNFLLMDGPYGRMTVDGQLHIGGTTDFPDVSGDLTIPSAVVKLPDIASTLVKELSGLEKPKELAPEEMPANVHVLTNDGPVSWHTYETGERAEEVPFDMNADVTIHIPRDFWVQNESQEVVMELSGDVHYFMEKGVEKMEGEVQTVRGELNLFSQPLTISTGTITFTGSPGIDPVLDIVSEADTPDYGVVSLKVSGRSSAPVVTFDSENGYDPADILAILVIGKPLSESSDPNDSIKVASEIESLAAGVLAGIAQKQIADKIPIDYLEIKADSFSSADLRVGKYITPKLFVSYKRKLTTTDTMEENVNEVRAEYQLSRSLYFESFYGDAGIWGGDINWRKNY